MPKIDTENKEYYDPNFSPDIVHYERKRVIDNMHNYYAPHLLSYFLSKEHRIRVYTPKIYRILKKLLNNSRTTLYNKGRIKPKLFFRYWYLIEESGHQLDEFGMLKEKIDYEEQLRYWEDFYKYIHWDVIFKADKKLFFDGSINIVVGGMGQGKSNLCLALALAVAQRSNNYEIITNFKMKDMDQFTDVHFVGWLSELLKIACKNQMKNIELLKEGKRRLCKTMICIMDEGENFVQSARSGSKELVDFNSISQMFRKLSISMTLIFHRYKDIPVHIRNNPSLNCIIFKGADKEGNKIKMDIDKVLLHFPGDETNIWLRGIPKIDQLDTYHTSSFKIKRKSNPEKSIDVEEIINVASECDGFLAPKMILNEIEKVRIENIKPEELIKEVKRIERLNREDMLFCTNKTDYLQLIISRFENAFNIEDINLVQGLKKIVENAVNQSWSIRKIEENIEKKKIEKEISEFDYRVGQKDELLKFLNNHTVRSLKEVVKERRLFNLEEHQYLTASGISKSKLRVLYGEIKEVMQITKDFVI